MLNKTKMANIYVWYSVRAKIMKMYSNETLAIAQN